MSERQLAGARSHFCVARRKDSKWLKPGIGRVGRREEGAAWIRGGGTAATSRVL